MIVLLAVLTILVLLLRRVLAARQFSKPQSNASSKSKKPSVQEKLSAEAFEFAPASPLNPQNVLVLYATEYGFAREVARKLAENLSQLTASDSNAIPITINPRIINVLHYPLIDFTRETFVAFICSTTGDGVPPNESAAFRDALVSRDLVLPPTCRVSTLALGDRAYPHFCRAGRVFDTLLTDSRLLDRVDIDQEDWSVINEWFHQLSDALTKEVNAGTMSEDHDYLQAAIDKYVKTMDSHGAQYTRNNPFNATLAYRRPLTAPITQVADDKEVVRVEFDISGSGMRYEVGDALAVVPKNNSEAVTRLLLSMASNGDEMVRVADKGDPIVFETALTENLDLRVVRSDLISCLGQRSDQPDERELAGRLLQGEHLTAFGKKYVAEREVFDVLSDFVSAGISAQELAKLLRPLHARYYSISSTPVTKPDSVAATVDVLRYSTLNIEREGVASTYLQDRCRVGETQVPVFIMKNPNFRLPKDGSKPVVMVGPGTGIAPFIGFVEERIASGAGGENWLFFGCRHEQQDFLYSEQLSHWSDQGHLSLHTAFSRDGPTKVYVQLRMRENAEQLWKLIDFDGAHVYVCGDGGHMAGDVDIALQDIVSEYGQRNPEEAAAYLAEMSEEKRYQRDVWVP